MTRHTQEIAIAAANVVLLLVLAFTVHGFFTAENLADLFLANMPVMLMALGMTAVILTAQIDISVGSIFALCSIVAGITAKAGAPAPMFLLAAVVTGAACGALNGALTAWVRIPSIVVTLASMVALRDGLRWGTQGAWVGGLPASFVRFGMDSQTYTTVVLVLTVVMTIGFAWALRNLRAGRMIFATGSNAAAAQQMGINTQRVVFSVFVILGALTGLAATLNAVRFQQVPSNSGMGMELKVIAAVAVGGAAITGGSATITGTVLGVILLGIIGPALTFLGVSAYWEKALQGAIILVAVSFHALSQHRRKRTAEVAIG
ncbi:MAG TPA: ABC transporter permease [Terriglobus sp.]